MWRSEYQGAFSNALNANYGNSDPERVTCFCQYYQAKAKSRGIHPGRAREGYRSWRSLYASAKPGNIPGTAIMSLSGG
jgi:hypothetical protein